MYGGPSQLDTFDYKPHLVGRDGQTVTVRSFREGNKPKALKLMEPRWKFKPYGRCGKYVSDLFPHVATCVDDIAFVHSFYAESPIHGSAMPSTRPPPWRRSRTPSRGSRCCAVAP